MVMGRTLASPSHTFPPLISPLARSSSTEIPVTLWCYAPVTVESVPDEDDAARHQSHEALVSTEIGSHIRVNQVPGHLEIDASRAPASMCTWDSPSSQALVLQGLGPKACSTGSVDVERMLNEPNGSARLSRSVRSRAPSSIEHKFREYAEQAEVHSQAALDLNQQALGLLMESMENSQQAQTQAVCARQQFEDLLSVSSCQHERVCLRQCAEDESIDHIVHEARDQHRRQADYECCLRSNVLTAEERQNIKPSPISSIRLESSNMLASFSCNADSNVSAQDSGPSVSVPRQSPPRSPGPRNPGRMGVDDWVRYTQQNHPLPPADGHDFLGADPSGRHCARSPPIGHGYPGIQGNWRPAKQLPM